MKTISISGSLRESVGKKGAGEVRAREMVPCVVYGGKEQIHFSALEKDFKSLVYTPDVHMVKLDVGGKTFNAIMQDIQFHKVTDKIIHVDFLEVIPGKPVVMDIPVRTKGTSEGVREGGKLHVKSRKLRVKGLPEKFPDNIMVDITKMKIGDSVRVGDIKLDGLQLLNAPNITVVAVRVTRAAVEEEVAPTATTAATPGTPGAPAAAAPGAAPAVPAPGAPAGSKKEEKKDDKKK